MKRLLIAIALVLSFASCAQKPSVLEATYEYATLASVSYNQYGEPSIETIYFCTAEKTTVKVVGDSTVFFTLRGDIVEFKKVELLKSGVWVVQEYLTGGQALLHGVPSPLDITVQDFAIQTRAAIIRLSANSIRCDVL